MRPGPDLLESTRTPVSNEMRISDRPRWGFGHGFRYLVLLFLFLVTALVGASPVESDEDQGDARGKPSMESVFSEVELVRCVFREGRLVVKYQGKLKVLHLGDELQEAGLKVVEAEDDRIVLQTIETKSLPSGLTLPKAMVILSRGPEGRVNIQTFSSEHPNGAAAFEVPQNMASSGPAHLKSSDSEPLAIEPPALDAPTETRHTEDRP